MKKFTEEMLKTLEKAYNATKGTKDYTKYLVCCEAKTNGRWHFVGWHFPSTTGHFKKVNGITYIITEMCGDIYRYEVSNEIKSLFGI